LTKKIEKNCETLRHWKHEAIFQFIDSETLNSIQRQCWKLIQWKPTQCRFADPYCECWFCEERLNKMLKES